MNFNVVKDKLNRLKHRKSQSSVFPLMIDGKYNLINSMIHNTNVNLFCYICKKKFLL